MVTPHVSVIIPTYNRANTLGRAIQSVLRQTYLDFEIVVVDDGSTDRTQEVVAGFGRAVRYVYQKNSGRSAARNRGLAVAAGRFVAFLDSDDAFLPSKLERQLELMERHSEAMLSHTSYARVDEQGTLIEDIHSGRFSGNVFPRILTGCPIATPTVLVRRDKLDKNLRFDEGIDVAEDVILWAQIAAAGPVLGIDECLSKVSHLESSSAACRSAQVNAFRNITNHVVRGTFPLATREREEVLADLCSCSVVAGLFGLGSRAEIGAVREAVKRTYAGNLPLKANLRRRILVDSYFHAALQSLRARRPWMTLKYLATCLRVAPFPARLSLLVARKGTHFVRTRIQVAPRYRTGADAEWSQYRGRGQT